MAEETRLIREIVILNKKIHDLTEENEKLNQNLDSFKSKQEYVVELESKIYQLTKKVTELEQENANLAQGNQILPTSQEYIENLENRIIEYDEKIASLEKINRMHRENIDKLRAGQSTMVADLEKKIMEQNDYVASLIKENRDLRKQLEQMEHDNKEQNISALQKRVASLEMQNNELEEKNQVLKAALLLHVDMETTDLSDTTIKSATKKIPEKSIEEQEIKSEEQIEIPSSEPIPEIPQGKVQELVKQRHAALEAREYPVEHPVITDQDLIEKPVEQNVEFPAPPVEPQVKSPSPKAIELPEIDDIGVIETSEGRRKCPICGNENLRLIREVEDKSKIISVYPRLYGKKLKCGQCGAEWR